MQLTSGHLLPYKTNSQIIILPTPDHILYRHNDTCLHLPGKLPGYLICKKGNSSQTPAIKRPAGVTKGPRPSREIANGVGTRTGLRSN